MCKTERCKTYRPLNYLLRSAGEFHKVIIFTGPTLDEPLYNAIRESSEKVKACNDIDKMPNLQDLERKGMYNKPKLIIFYHNINLSPKELKNTYKYIVSSRKNGC